MRFPCQASFFCVFRDLATSRCRTRRNVGEISSGVVSPVILRGRGGPRSSRARNSGDGGVGKEARETLGCAAEAVLLVERLMRASSAPALTPRRRISASVFRAVRGLAGEGGQGDAVVGLVAPIGKCGRRRDRTC